MACVENVICLGEFCACADMFVLTQLVAPFTGSLLMLSEFNGVKLKKIVSVREGDPITIPNIFNENYTNILSFYNGSQLLNDVSYSVKTIYCFDSENIFPMPTEDNSIVINTIAGNTITDIRIVGRFITALIINDVSKNTKFSVTGDTITFTDGTILDNGQTVTIFFQ